MTKFILCGGKIAMCNPYFNMNLKNVTGFVIGETVCEHTQRLLKCTINLKYAMTPHTWDEILLEKHCLCEN